jgi:hypothetical protein
MYQSDDEPRHRDAMYQSDDEPRHRDAMYQSDDEPRPRDAQLDRQDSSRCGSFLTAYRHSVRSEVQHDDWGLENKDIARKHLSSPLSTSKEAFARQADQLAEDEGFMETVLFIQELAVTTRVIARAIKGQRDGGVEFREPERIINYLLFLEFLLPKLDALRMDTEGIQ